MSPDTEEDEDNEGDEGSGADEGDEDDEDDEDSPTVQRKDAAVAAALAAPPTSASSAPLPVTLAELQQFHECLADGCATDEDRDHILSRIVSGLGVVLQRLDVLETGRRQEEEREFVPDPPIKKSYMDDPRLDHSKDKYDKFKFRHFNCNLMTSVELQHKLKVDQKLTQWKEKGQLDLNKTWGQHPDIDRSNMCYEAQQHLGWSVTFFDKSMQTRIANYTRQVKNRALRQGTLTPPTSPPPTAPTPRTSAQPSTVRAFHNKRPRETTTSGAEEDEGDEGDVDYEDVLDYVEGDEISIIVRIDGFQDPVVVAHGKMVDNEFALPATHDKNFEPGTFVGTWKEITITQVLDKRGKIELDYNEVRHADEEMSMLLKKQRNLGSLVRAMKAGSDNRGLDSVVIWHSLIQLRIRETKSRSTKPNARKKPVLAVARRKP